MDRIIGRLFACALCVCMLFQPVTALGADSTSGSNDMKVEIVKTSSDYGSGYYVAYTINGIPYRSDIAGKRINQIAFTHMSDEQKEKTLFTFGFGLNERINQFGMDFSGEMAAWYRKYSRLDEAQEILADRLAKNNFPEYRERFSDSTAYFREYFEPKCQFSYFPELERLYEEEKLVFSWAEEAYKAMVRAQLIQTSIAVKSLSGDLIQLIVDRALVPNITPSGCGGVAAQINGIIGDYVNSTMHISDNIQDMVLGKRVSAKDARAVIDQMAEMIAVNKEIIQECTKEAHRLQKEIENRFAKLETEYEEKIDAMVESADAAEAAVIEASPIDETPDASIVSEISSFDAQIQKETDSDKKAALQEARRNYIRQQYNAAMSEFQSWCTLYFGGPDPEKPEAGSVLGDFYSSWPSYPANDNTEFDLYMTDSQANAWEKGAKDYADNVKQYHEKRIQMRQESYQKLIEARKKYDNIISRVNAVTSMAGNEIEPYGTGEWKDLTVSRKYIDSLDKYAGINEDPAFTYKKALQDELEYCAGAYGEDYRAYAYRFAFEDMNGTVDYSQDRIDCYVPSYIDDIKYQMEKLDQFHEDVSKEIKAYKDLRDEYEVSYSDFETLLKERNDFLDNNVPEYVYNYDDLADLCFGDDNTGTPEDVIRIGNETDGLYKQYELINSQIKISEMELVTYAGRVKAESSRLSKFFDGSNPALAEDAKPWTESDFDAIFGPSGIEADGKATEHMYWSTMGDELRDIASDLEFVADDFSGRTWANEQYIEIFAELSDNKEEFKTEAGSERYKQLKRQTEELEPKENSYAAHIVYKTSSEGGSGSGAEKVAGWPYPYEDLVEPLIREIDEARAAGRIDWPEIVRINFDDSNLAISGMEEVKTYDGIPQEQDVTLSVDGTELVPGTDYEITYENNENAGIAKMTITGRGRYIGVVERVYTIAPADIYGLRIPALADRTYTGKKIEQKPELFLDKYALIEMQDCTFGFENNKNVGKAVVNITGHGNFAGERTLTFKINPKPSKIKSVKAKKKGCTVKWAKVSQQATGYQIQTALNSKFTKSKKTYKITSYKTVSKTISKLKAGKKYYVRVRTYKNVKEGGKTVPYYSEWTKAKSVKTK